MLVVIRNTVAPPVPCPHCGAEMVNHMSMQGNYQPEEGSIAVCSECGGVSRHREVSPTELGLDPLDPASMDPCPERDMIVAASSRFRERARIRRGEPPSPERAVLLKRLQAVLLLSQFQVEKSVEELDKVYDDMSDFTKGFLETLPDDPTREDVDRFAEMLRVEN